MHKKLYFMLLGGSVGVTVLSLMAQMIPRASATQTATQSTASVTVAASCSMTSTVNTEHTATINNGQSRTGIGQTTLKALCNDTSGFAIYAVGYGQDTVGTTVLHSEALSSTNDITTGTATSGDVSNWSMQVAAVSGTYAPSITNNFDSAHAVPSQYTKVAQFGAITDSTTGSSVTTTYNAYISPTQPAGTYVGKVKYVLVHPSGSTISDNLTMQSVALWKDTMLEGETYRVTDTRDNKEYYVAKLEDGNVWMTQNLDLCIGCSGTTELTSENTDLTVAGTGAYTNGYLVDGNGVITWTPSGTTMEGAPATIPNFASGNNSGVTGWSNDQVHPYMAEGGTRYVASNKPYTTRDDCIRANSAEVCDHDQVGNYYNWTASIASNDSTAISARYATADNSICPAGWRLPKGPNGTNGSEFETMLKDAGIANPNNTDNGTSNAVNVNYTTGGLAKMESSPYFFARFGSVYDSTLYSVANYGYYWSGSAVSSTYAYGLYFNSGELYPAYQYYRVYGRSVRCLAR